MLVMSKNQLECFTAECRWMLSWIWTQVGICLW